MKALFFVGLVVLILGIVSLVVPVPRSEREGVSFRGVSLDVVTRREEKIHPGLSAMLILGGWARWPQQSEKPPDLAALIVYTLNVLRQTVYSTTVSVRTTVQNNGTDRIQRGTRD